MDGWMDGQVSRGQFNDLVFNRTGTETKALLCSGSSIVNIIAPVCHCSLGFIGVSPQRSQVAWKTPCLDMVKKETSLITQCVCVCVNKAWRQIITAQYVTSDQSFQLSQDAQLLWIWKNHLVSFWWAHCMYVVGTLRQIERGRVMFLTIVRVHFFKWLTFFEVFGDQVAVGSSSESPFSQFSSINLTHGYTITKMVDLMYSFYFSDLKGRNGWLQMEKSELERLHCFE